MQGGKRHSDRLLLLHEANQNNRSFFAVVGLENGANPPKRPVIQIHRLTGFDATMLRHGMQAVFYMLDDVIRDGGRLIAVSYTHLALPTILLV